MKLTTLFIIGLFFLPLNANAHGPTPQKADEKIVINASIEKTWEVLKDFDNISTWHPDVKSSKGDGKNQSDSVRTMTLSNDEETEESLDYYSEKDHEYRASCKTPNFTSLYLLMSLICIFKKIKTLPSCLCQLFICNFQVFSKFRAYLSCSCSLNYFF